MQRISVVGCSGAGKSTLARELAARLAVPCLELDELNHQADWVELDNDDFRRLVGDVTAGPAWVVDGNYRRRLGGLVLERADTVVWLDYPRWLTTSRVAKRTVGRLVRREELWNGNRETWSALLSLDPMHSVLVHSWRLHGDLRARCVAERQSPKAAHVTYLRFGSPRETAAWLRTVRPRVT